MKIQGVNLFFLFLLFGCGNKTATENKNSTDSLKQYNGRRESQIAADTNSNDLQLFSNIEMAEYCILLPLNEFKEDVEIKDPIKARHEFKFIQNNSSDNYMDVQGFLLNEKDHDQLKKFYLKNISETEEGGLGIDTAIINTFNKYFIIKGCQPNFRDKKFIKIVWVNEDEVVLNIAFNKKDSLLWEKRISEITQRGIFCP